jgi:hypothetical protein
MSSSQNPPTSTAFAAIPTGNSLEVVIGDAAYQLPSSNEGPMEVMLVNGSLAQLFADRVIVEGQTVTVPSQLGSATELPGGITAKPAEATTPYGSDTDEDNNNNDDEDDGSGVGLFAALGGIAGGATSALGGAINSIGSVSTTAMAFAGQGAGAATAFTAPLSGAIGGMSSVVSSFNGIQKSFPGSELKKTAFDTLTSAHTLARQTLNWMKSTQGLVQGFSNLPADVQSKVRARVGEFAKAGGQLEQCRQALETFKDFPWEEAEVPEPTQEPSATNEPTNTESVQSTQISSISHTTTSMISSTQLQSTTQTESTKTTSSQTSTSSSSTPTPTVEVEKTYVICSKQGTPWTSFKNLTENTNVVQGSLARWDNIGSYMCLVKANATQAQIIARSYDFIRSIDVHEGGLEDEEDGAVENFRAVISTPKDDSKPFQSLVSLFFRKTSMRAAGEAVSLVPRTMRSPDPGAPWWKKMLSAPPPSSDEEPLAPSDYPGYLADDTGGAGTTIYILDDGFDISIPVCWLLIRYLNLLTVTGLGFERKGC